MVSANVAYWHVAADPGCPRSDRYWGISGRATLPLPCWLWDNSEIATSLNSIRVQSISVPLDVLDHRVERRLTVAGISRDVQDKGHLHVQWGADPRYVELYEKVTAQVVDLVQNRRREFARDVGSPVRASMMAQPCFLAVDRNERMSAKSMAPSIERNPPEIFWRNFIMRPSRSA